MGTEELLYPEEMALEPSPSPWWLPFFLGFALGALVFTATGRELAARAARIPLEAIEKRIEAPP